MTRSDISIIPSRPAMAWMAVAVWCCLPATSLMAQTDRSAEPTTHASTISVDPADRETVARWIDRLRELNARSLTGAGGVATNDFGLNTGSFAEAERIQQDKIASVKIVISEQPPNTWDVSCNRRILAPVQKGDWVIATFTVQGQTTQAPGGGVAEFVFETAGPPHTKSVQYLCESPADGSPARYFVRFRSALDYDAGGAMLNFQLGYVRQTVSIGNVQAWTVDGEVAEFMLPHTPQSYPGREKDAAWRAEAKRRIEEIRQHDIQWTLTDADGRPLSNRDVDVELVRHDFDFGTAVSASQLMGEDDVAARYRQTFLEHFNAATIENALKWQQWDGNPPQRSQTLEALRWLRTHDVPARGHVLVWPGRRYLPEHIIDLLDRPDVLAPVINTHIRELGFATGDLVRDWDVLNEVFDNRDLTNSLGDEAMTRWFHAADAVMPEVDLYYNDYAGLVRGGFPTGHKQHFEKTVRYLVNSDAPIDGIGIQSHFGSILTSPTRMLAELDRWEAMGLKVLITEFDVEVQDKTLQADFTEDFLICCYSHPAVVGVMTWGFYEGNMWKPDAALFDTDWNPTPMGERWVKLVGNTWRTKRSLRTDPNGAVQFRGHRGVYRIRRGNREWFLRSDAANHLAE